MEMIWLRVYLMSGLIAHKVVWEAQKRKQQPQSRHPGVSLRLALVKWTKIAILLAILVQTLAPEVLPITDEPFVLRVVGAVIYTLGLVLAIVGRIHLGNNWADIETAQVLKNQVLVSDGLYRYLQHPIYTGDLLLLGGLELALNSWLVVAVGALAPVVVWKALREEDMLAMTLPGYDAYRARTKRFVPFIV